MAVNYVRKTSETPNINNSDDTRALRFAFGNQNGFIPGRGTDLAHEIDGNSFKIKAGEFVVQGCQVSIDSAGAIITPSGGILFDRYYTIYARLNLATEVAEVLAEYGIIGSYPSIPASDNLTANSSGTAHIELYRIVVNASGVITNVIKRINAVSYYSDAAAIKTGTIADARLPATAARTNGTYADMTVGSAANAVQAVTKNRHDNSTAIATTAYVDRGYEELYYNSSGAFEVNTAAIANWSNYEYFQIFIRGVGVGYAWAFMPRTAAPNVDETLGSRTVRMLTSVPLRLFNSSVIPMSIGYLVTGGSVTATLTSSDSNCRIIRILGVK